MKKMLVAAIIAVVGMAFTAPAFAVEHEFGGYWRTRAFSYNNFTGEDKTEAYDYQAVDTRTRLYYTAVLNDYLKFVNKFEFDADWGDSGYGDIGTDGKGAVEVKNSYADFTMGSVNAKVGAHALELSRGFLFADDMMGATITFQGNGFAIPFVWVKPYDGGNGKDANDDDVDYYAIAPSFTAGSVVINPVVMYATSDNITAWDPKVNALTSGVDYSFNSSAPKLSTLGAFDDMDVYFLGLNLDATLGAAKVWFTGLYEDGSIDMVGGGDLDVSAYIVALGASMNVGMADVHGQAFYASGDDDATDSDLDAFWVPSQGAWYGQSYYWAEIMGYGMMDDMVSNGSCGDKISNIMAINLGTSMKPMNKLTLKADLWYAELAEEDYVNGEKDLGFEVDLGLTYELVENLNLDLIAAYLFAGDRTNMDPTTGLKFDNDADPYELGARLSLSF